MDDNQFLQAVLPAAKVGSDVFSARLLALPAFLASAVGAKNVWSEIFGLEHVNGSYDDALKGWFELGEIEMAREYETHKNWKEPIFDSEICASLPDWHSATFRRNTKERLKVLTTEKCCEEG